MIQTRIINEINQSYLEIITDNISASEDYRLRMLDENEIDCFLKKTVHCIDGISSDYYDISGKESLISFFNLRVADRNEMLKLFGAMAKASKEAEQLLIEEGNIIFRPECIFIDSKTMNYQFICIPSEDCEENLALNLRDLIQFFLTRLDENDIDLLKTIYSMFDRTQSNGINCKILKDLFCEGTEKITTATVQKETAITPDKKEKNEFKGSGYYTPSAKGVVAIVFATVGVFLIGYHAYLMLLLNR